VEEGEGEKRLGREFGLSGSSRTWGEMMLLLLLLLLLSSSIGFGSLNFQFGEEGEEEGEEEVEVEEEVFEIVEGEEEEEE